VRPGTAIALIIGVAAMAAAVVQAGSGAVAQALERLHMGGLLVLVLLHLPIVVLMGCAWWLASGDDPPASQSRFVWARFVRDAAAEVLPLLHLGGVVFGLRALGRGRASGCERRPRGRSPPHAPLTQCPAGNAAAHHQRPLAASSVSAGGCGRVSRCTCAVGVWAPQRPGSSSGCSA
jgi:hypothetical protein